MGRSLVAPRRGLIASGNGGEKAGSNLPTKQGLEALAHLGVLNVLASDLAAGGEPRAGAGVDPLPSQSHVVAPPGAGVAALRSEDISV